jgi:hypothetical protein
MPFLTQTSAEGGGFLLNGAGGKLIDTITGTTTPPPTTTLPLILAMRLMIHASWLLSLLIPI